MEVEASCLYSLLLDLIRERERERERVCCLKALLGSEMLTKYSRDLCDTPFTADSLNITIHHVCSKRYVLMS